ncbi:hypothetical protein A3K01_00165 [candidate division WWE3 bacterium RIFOXYD1_FULL_43_17]|uniref:Gram-positive cocci surface proteins LPxTG domain-containing protein n=3 Tax=Katanobacteria TaxID=422282 RepID=A0A1F4XDI8_UNCKA|nr:MAG: hypothetical protein UU59_C0007G0017 [candidate division WWE3 bacterium GW2011_GWE1_41_27]KKS60701.1 MAG: hypothetical protein UV26_C0002G0027 [candidate division WWE3 bacterium GW2011_GWF2_42_42]OGC79203.1 MAG: hypothetical protein A3K01_00165 [candidate division WWE3 bacterium RIFOXYD1_FULL_43_17]
MQINPVLKATLLTTIFAVVFSSHVFSASLSLTKIGAIDTTGNNYPEWWYTQTNATLTGTATDGSQVSVKVGDAVNNVNVASGIWSYDLSGESKDYPVEISQGAEKISFVLHLGQMLPDTVSAGSSPQTGSTVPETGYNQLIAISLGAGIVLLASYFYFWGDLKKRTVFEARMIRED